MKRKLNVLVLLMLLVSSLAWPAVTAAESGGPRQPLVHVVQRGETLFSIARRYGTTVETITHANGIPDPRHIFVGQTLRIPSELGPVETWSAHVVQNGESLTAIAARHGVHWRSLALANRLTNPHLLYNGQVLHVPDPVNEMGALHTVQPGETLLEVALRYDLPLWDLAEANSLVASRLLMPGQRVLVPGAQPAWMPLPFTAVEVSPVPVRQGQAMLITVHVAEEVTLEGQVFDRPLHFAQENGAYYAMAGVHTFTEPGLYELRITAVDGSGRQASVDVGVVVTAERYGHERIDVPPGRTNLLDPAVVAIENDKIAAARATMTPERRWHGPFLRPVRAAISSYFGTRRSYNGSPYTSYHGGVDFNAGGGTPIHAAADGTVVMAEPLWVRGNVVVLDHGWGLLTGYWHLSAIDVAPGQEVLAGDVIGRVGNTGLSTGSHLHWEVWAGGVSVDALQWLEDAYPWASLDAGGANAQ
jgi:murein DD-endopeptidase MepM/ murein hydrolase activator NlpD